MKRLLLIFALLSAAGCSAFGQTYASTQCHSTSANSCAGSTISVTSGQTIVVGVVVSPTTSTMSVTDSSSNTYSVCTNGTTPAGPTTYQGSVSEVFCATAAATNASLTITIHGSGSINDLFGVMLSPSSGGLTTVDQVGITTASSGTAWTSASVTTTAASELLVGVCAGSYNGSGGTMTATSGSGYTLAQTYNGGGPSIGIEYQAVSSTGSYQAKITNSASTSYTCFIVTFEASITTLANPIPVYNAGATTSFTMPSGSTGCYTVDGSTPTATTPGTCSHGTSCSSSACTNISPSGLNTVQILATEAGDANSSVVTVQPDIAVASDNFSSYYNQNWALPSSPNTSISESGTTVTVTSPYPVSPGNGGYWGQTSYNLILSISGSSVAAYNGTWQSLSSNNGSQWTFTAPSSGIANCSSGCGITYVPMLYNTLGAEQKPLDVDWTSGAWQTNVFDSLLTGYLTPAPDPLNSGAFMALAASETGSNECGIYGCQSIRSNESYYQHHSVIAYIHPGSGNAIVGSACVSGGKCEVLQVSSTAATLYDGSSSSVSNVATTSGLTVADGSFIELRGEPGCVFRPLINGLQITGMSATYTISGCSTSGQPMIGAGGGTWPSPSSVYNVSFYNIGGSSPGGYTKPSPAAYTTYTDAMNSSGWAPQSPWLPYFPWGLGFAAISSPLGYGAGNVGSPTIQMQINKPFGVNQWESFTVNAYPWVSGLGWWLGQLQQQPWVPGATDGGCTGENYTSTSCTDTQAYWLGITLGSISTNYACTVGKDEYCGTPFVHGTKVTPASSPGNDVVTFAGSFYTLLPGDIVENRYLNGYVESWCKQGSAPNAFLNSHAYSTGNWFEDSNGNVQLVTTAGTSQSSGTPTWGTTWNSSTYKGAYTTSGGMISEYFGALCPSTAKFTRVIHVYDADLMNPSSTYGGYPPTIGGLPQALGIGFPGIAVRANPETDAVYSLFSAGTVGYGTGEPCAAFGQCVETGFVLSSGGIF